MPDEQFTTLGERLARQAQRLAARRVPEFGWLRPLTTVLDHLAARPTPSASRFARVEAPVSLDDLQARGATPARARGDEQAIASHAPTPAPPAAAAAAPVSIPPAAVARLDDLVGPGAGAARVHTDDVADRVARAERADAVTVGRDIFFRQDAYRPDDARGFALLTHEVVHVLRALGPGAAWQRATGPGVADEEHTARAAEAGALHAARSGGPPPAIPDSSGRGTGAPLVPPSLPPASPRATVPLATPHLAPAPTTAARPMAAATDRPSAAPAAAGQPPSPADLDALRRTLYRDLMQQIRADAERGG